MQEHKESNCVVCGKKFNSTKNLKKERPESAPERAQKEESKYEGARLYRQYRGCRVHHRHQ